MAVVRPVALPFMCAMPFSYQSIFLTPFPNVFHMRLVAGRCAAPNGSGSVCFRPGISVFTTAGKTAFTLYEKAFPLVIGGQIAHMHARPRRVRATTPQSRRFEPCKRMAEDRPGTAVGYG